MIHLSCFKVSYNSHNQVHVISPALTLLVQFFGSLASVCVIVATNCAGYAEPTIQTRHDSEL